MFTAFLADFRVWQPVLRHDVLRESLAWLEKHASSAAFGDHQLGEPGWYANLHGYTTLPESDCIWENHTRTIDIQYMVGGCEGIRWGALCELGAPLRYLEEMDREEFPAPQGAAGALIHLRPGRFAIFLPGDAHCPKIRLSAAEVERKVVVKIPLRLLEEQV